ncbi:hypothetical protein [Kluyvera ascorbata]|uniref:hypothetical protein n=1 Tax=Kluyvera ascorbata TaxID=51288 RepID=UPI00330B048C|nr:hypothetical protein [Kluyvera ascorbata]
MTLIDNISPVLVDTACIVLTENQYLYCGLSELLCQAEFFHVLYDGTGTENWNTIKERACILVIIDGSIFREGKWHGFEKIQRLYPHARRVWLMAWDNWGMWPYGCNRDRILSPKWHLSVFARRLWSLLKGDDGNIDIPHYPVLTKKEKLLAEYFLSGNSIHTVSEQITRSEKLIYKYRSSIQEKLGFRMAVWMVFTYRKNHAVFTSEWLLHFNEIKCLCRKCRCP